MKSSVDFERANAGDPYEGRADPGITGPWLGSSGPGRVAEPLVADDRQQAQLVRVFGAGRGGVDEQGLALVGGDQLLAVELDRADARMRHPLAVPEPDRHFVLAP